MQSNKDLASKGDGIDEEKDKKPSASQQEATLSLPMKHGFTFAMENLKPEELPGYVKQYFNALTFPEKLMLMLVHIEKMSAKEGRSGANLPVAWTQDGTAFVVRNKEELVKKWLPLFFSQAKFSSFTRKLYRWGFRKLMISKDGDKGATEVAFGNIYFQRGDHALMSRMQSITAAKLRKESSSKAERQDRETTSAKTSPSGHLRVLHSHGDERFSSLASMFQSQPFHGDQGSANVASMTGSQQLQGDQLASSLLLSQLQQLGGGQSSPDLASLSQIRQFQGGQGSANLAALAQLQQYQGCNQVSTDLASLFQLAQLQGDQAAAMILSSLSQFQPLQGNYMSYGAAGSSALNAPIQYSAETDRSISLNAQLQSTTINPNELLALLSQSHSLQNPVQVQQYPTSTNASDQLNVQRSLMQTQGGMNPFQVQRQPQGQQGQQQGVQQQQVQRQQPTHQGQPPPDEEQERLTQQISADTFRR